MIKQLAFGGIGNLSSGITLPHNMNLFAWYLAPFGNTIYSLGVFSPSVDITVAGYHRLILIAFCSHTGCWSRSGGSSLAWASCPAYSCLLERLLNCCRGALVTAGRVVLKLLFPTTRNDFFCPNTLKQQTQGQRSHSYNKLNIET